MDRGTLLAGGADRVRALRDRGGSRSLTRGAATLGGPVATVPDARDPQGGRGMVDTPDAVRRDIEITRERMSTTLAQLEQKVNVMQQVRDHPWAAIGIAVGAGAALGVASNRTRGSSESRPLMRAEKSRVATLIDGVMVYLLRGLRQVAEQQIDS